MIDNIVPLHKAPTAREAKFIIETLVKEGKISWSKHCKERMHEREIIIPQILNCLLKGKITEGPAPANSRNGWEACLEKVAAGEWLKVVVCLRFDQRLLVITAIN